MKFKRLLALILAVIMLVTVTPISVFAEETEDEVKVVTNASGTVIGTYQEDGSILFEMQGDAHANGNALYTLLSTDKKKTIVLPKKKIKIDRVLFIGNNTTLIATGATVFQTEWEKPLINNTCDKINYNSTKNVTIIGGKWQIKNNEKALKDTSTFRFIHSKNLTFKNCKIDTNYRSHAIELIACKNVTVDNCKLLSKGKTFDKIDEALQIDIATKATAPTFASMASKFLNGQTCHNITVKNCTIRGARGICANKTDTENGKWLSKHHTNITITNNTITGKTLEGVVLNNTAGFTVKNNTIVSLSSNSDKGYTIGLSILSYGANSAISNRTNIISGNTIKGDRQGLYMNSYTQYSYGKTTVKNNKFYAKSGASNGYIVYKCSKLVKANNKTYKWS